MNKPWNDHTFGIAAELVTCERCDKELDPSKKEDLCRSCFGIMISTDLHCVKAFTEHLVVKYHDEFEEFARKYFKALPKE